jgi:hypothetical protein
MAEDGSMWIEWLVDNQWRGGIRLAPAARRYGYRDVGGIEVATDGTTATAIWQPTDGVAVLSIAP